MNNIIEYETSYDYRCHYNDRKSIVPCMCLHQSHNKLYGKFCDFCGTELEQSMCNDYKVRATAIIKEANS